LIGYRIAQWLRDDGTAICERIDEIRFAGDACLLRDKDIVRTGEYRAVLVGSKRHLNEILAEIEGAQELCRCMNITAAQLV
jgi:hypothetical protein